LTKGVKASKIWWTFANSIDRKIL